MGDRVPGRLKVGIIDDDDDVSRILSVMLEKAGCLVTGVASTFQQAMALLENPACQAVFVDLYLNGSPQGTVLAQHAAEKGLAVVAMTGSPVLPPELSGVALLLKPFSGEQLNFVVHKLRESAGQLVGDKRDG